MFLATSLKLWLQRLQQAQVSLAYRVLALASHPWAGLVSTKSWCHLCSMVWVSSKHLLKSMVFNLFAGVLQGMQLCWIGRQQVYWLGLTCLRHMGQQMSQLTTFSHKGTSQEVTLPRQWQLFRFVKEWQSGALLHQIHRLNRPFWFYYNIRNIGFCRIIKN